MGVPLNRYRGGISPKRSASHQRKYVTPHSGKRPGFSRPTINHLPTIATPNVADSASTNAATE
jgi:hypothetical protein